MPIRVVLAVAHEGTRREAAETLEHDGDIVVVVVVKARTRGEVVFETRLLEPDAVVLELVLPQHGAVQATRQIVGRQPPGMCAGRCGRRWKPSAPSRTSLRTC